MEQEPSCGSVTINSHPLEGLRLLEVCLLIFDRLWSSGSEDKNLQLLLQCRQSTGLSDFRRESNHKIKDPVLNLRQSKVERDPAG